MEMLRKVKQQLMKVCIPKYLAMCCLDGALLGTAVGCLGGGWW
jgi:TctA family transporter